MKNRSGEKIKLASIDELLGVVNEESAMEIEISKIHPFKNHPFKVLDDEKMQDLVESVKINGVLTPVLLRMDEINQIQMLSIFNNCVMAKKVSRSLTFSEKKLTKYFPDDYTAKDMEQVIESLLEKWIQEQSC